MADATVNLNTADRRMLCKLRGVGGSVADRIIAGRPFASWEDFAARLGLSQAVLAKLQDPEARHVAVLGPQAQGMRTVAADDPRRREARAGQSAVSGDFDSRSGIAGGDPDLDRDDPTTDSDSDSTSEPLPKALARWERHRTHFLADRFAADGYYDSARDHVDAIAYYAPLAIGGGIRYGDLAQLLQRRRFGGRSKVMFPWFDRHPDGSLRCIYTGRELSDPAGALILKCDEEHCVPQSWQATKTAHTGRDIHQMFAAWKSANGHRGNRPFGDSGQPIERSEFGELFALQDCRQRLFLPALNRGAVARATLYVLVAYPGALDGGRVPGVSLAWLIRTAAQEPVALWERHRNAVAFAHQGNRNPFIDHPEWAQLLDFKGGFAP